MSSCPSICDTNIDVSCQDANPGFLEYPECSDHRGLCFNFTRWVEGWESEDLAENPIMMARHFPFPRSKLGLTLATISGSISAICSCLLIFVILRSSSKLKTTYHRIMIALSVSDFASSFSAALTTLPMPRPGYDKFVDAFGYQGKRMGNYSTCAAQGFFVLTGTFISLTYFFCLFIYYLCTIRFKIRPEIISRRIEPFLHLISVTIPAALFSILLQKNLFNVDPSKPCCWSGFHCFGENGPSFQTDTCFMW